MSIIFGSGAPFCASAPEIESDAQWSSSLQRLCQAGTNRTESAKSLIKTGKIRSSLSSTEVNRQAENARG
jgi:hypothetical protein